MNNLITPEDKKYLRRVSNYLNSLGLKYGEIRIETEYGDLPDSFADTSHFDNNYHAQIPDGLIDILDKILNYIKEEGKWNDADVDTSYEYLYVEIDTVTKELIFRHEWNFYSQADTQGIEWNLSEESENESFVELMEQLEEEFGDANLEVRYDGSGDSGYLESTFESGEDVPADLEDWCYRMLESSFGGWEINEGSSGYFVVDLKNKSIYLSHTYNTEESDSRTLFELNFSE